MSPRTAVSARFQGLNLQHTNLVDRVVRTEPELIKNDSIQCSSTTFESHSADDMLVQNTEPDGPVSIPTRYVPQDCYDLRQTPTIEAPPGFQGQDGLSLEMSPSSGARAQQAPPTFGSDARMDEPSPAKRARSDTNQVNMRAEVVLRSPSSPSPVKHPVRSSIPTTPSPRLSPAVPRSRSPSARKLATPQNRKATPESQSEHNTSTPESDPEFSALWWQDSEISGHDPEDPEEDNRGVNGIGYQKTRAEQSRISAKKQKQLAEWRSREAKEARALRSGRRTALQGVIGGRVTKSTSRSGSPVERRASPGVRGRKVVGVDEVLEMGLAMTPVETPSRKGVRFEESAEDV